MKGLLRLLVGWLLCFVCYVVQANDLLSEIRQSGRIVVGVKTDYPPWGMLAIDGSNAGYEPDLALLMAQHLGTEDNDIDVVFKSVSSTNRFRKLNDGEVDILIATVGDTLQRRYQVNLIHPHYFESGVRVLMHNQQQITQWSDLIGQPVCLTAGAYFNKTLVQSYRIEPIIMMSNRDVQLALLTGKCVAWAYDSGILFHLSNQPEWQDYQLGLENILPVYWSIVTRNGLESAALSQWVSEFLVTQIRSGKLLALAEKWQLPERSFLLDQQTLWRSQDASGQWLCRAEMLSAYDTHDCVNQPLAMTMPQSKGLWPFDAFDTQRLIQSLLHTAFFTLIAVLLAQVLATLFSYFTLRGPLGIGHVVAFFTSIQSSIPPILMLYLVYFGALPVWLNSEQTHFFNGVVISLLVLSLYTAAGINNLVTSGRPKDVPLLDLYLQHQVGVRANLVNLAKAAGMASVLASPNAVLVINSLVSGAGYPLLLMSLLALFYYLEVMFFAYLIHYLLVRLEHQAQIRPTSSVPTLAMQEEK